MLLQPARESPAAPPSPPCAASSRRTSQKEGALTPSKWAIENRLVPMTFPICAGCHQETITAESGQDVNLTCQAPKKNIAAVEWSRPDLEPQYVLLYRDEHLDTANQHPSFKNRVDLVTEVDGKMSLTLKDVKTDDTGIYECRVLQTEPNRRKRDVDPISIIRLSVVDPPGQTQRRAGLMVSLSLVAVLVVSAVGFLIYKKHKQQSQKSQLSPAEQCEIEMSLSTADL